MPCRYREEGRVQGARFSLQDFSSEQSALQVLSVEVMTFCREEEACGMSDLEA